MLSFNHELLEREVDLCFFNHSTFVAYFANEVGFKLLNLIKTCEPIERAEILKLIDCGEKADDVSRFIDVCIERGILTYERR